MPPLRKQTFTCNCYRIIIILLLILCARNFTYAQISAWNYKLYTTVDGLPSLVIRNVIQDKQGFIWVATESGLCRFDGDEFVTLIHDPNDSTSIPTNFISHVNILQDGRILVATRKGLFIMNAKTHHGFTMHLYTTKGWEALEDNVNEVLIDSIRNHVLVFTSTAVHVFDLSMKKIASVVYYKKYDNAPQLGDFLLNPVLLNNGDVLYFNRIIDKLSIFSIANMQLKTLDEIPQNPYYPYACKGIPAICSRDSSGNVWMYFENTDSIFCMKPEGHLLSWPLKEKFSWVQHILFPSATEMIWSTSINMRPQIASYNYAELMEQPGKYFSTMGKGGFEGSLAQLFVDKDKNWWIGCAEGLYFMRKNYQDFQTIKLPVPYNNSSGWQSVTDIVPVDINRLLITTSLEHCFIYNTKSNEITSFLDSVPLNNALNYFMNAIINLDNKRFLILGAQDFTYQNNRLIQGFTPTNEFEENYKKYATRSYYRSRDGVLWNSFINHGLTCWDSITQKVHNYIPPKAISMPHFTGIEEDSYGNLWLININQPGLIKFDRKKEQFTAVQNDKNKLLQYKTLRFITADDNDNIFIVYQDGLIIYNTKSDKIKNITMFDGLPSNIIFGSFYYNHRLFISSHNGWCVVNTDDYSIKVLKQYDGIAKGVTNSGYYLDTVQHKLYVGGDGVVYKIGLDNIFKSQMSSTVIINEIKVNDKTVNGNLGNISLNHNENNISLTVSSIDFYSDINKKYFYRITVNGDTTAWVSNKNNKRFGFINLSPGDYTIEIRSKNANYEWSANTATIHFTIASPWYNRWWFYSVCAFLIIAIVYGIFRYRLSQERKMHSMQQRISSDLHDDIGASLTSINILSQLSQQQKIDDFTRNEYLQKINEQTSEVTASLRDIVWSINPKNDKLDIILGRMKRYAAEVLETKNIDYSFESNIQRQDELTDANIRQNLYLIFKESVNNIAKYSAATSVLIALYKETNHIQLVIQDNGKGFHLQQVRNGNGIENMKRRAKIMNAKFNINSHPGNGTAIQLIIHL